MKAITLVLTICIPSILTGQYLQTFPETRTITVEGSAEMEVVADNIELVIAITRFSDGKYHANSMETLEQKFFDVLTSHNISPDRVKFKNQHYDWYYWWRNRRNINTDRKYVLTVTAEDDLLSLVKDLDFPGISSINVANATNDRIHEYRKEVKIRAMQAARDKAIYLLESVGEKLGPLLKVEELKENLYSLDRGTVNARVSTPAVDDGIENISMIKLRFEIRAQFEIASN